MMGLYLKPIFRRAGIWTIKFNIAPITTPKENPRIPSLSTKIIPITIIPKLYKTEPKAGAKNVYKNAKSLRNTSLKP